MATNVQPRHESSLDAMPPQIESPSFQSPSSVASTLSSSQQPVPTETGFLGSISACFARIWESITEFVMGCFCCCFRQNRAAAVESPPITPLEEQATQPLTPPVIIDPDFQEKIEAMRETLAREYQLPPSFNGDDAHHRILRRESPHQGKTIQQAFDAQQPIWIPVAKNLIQSLQTTLEHIQNNPHITKEEAKCYLEELPLWRSSIDFMRQHRFDVQYWYAFHHIATMLKESLLDILPDLERPRQSLDDLLAQLEANQTTDTEGLELDTSDCEIPSNYIEQPLLTIDIAEVRAELDEAFDQFVPRIIMPAPWGFVGKQESPHFQKSVENAFNERQADWVVQVKKMIKALSDTLNYIEGHPELKKNEARLKLAEHPDWIASQQFMEANRYDIQRQHVGIVISNLKVHVLNLLPE